MLRDFWENPKYKDAEQLLRAWFAEVESANWKSPNDIKRQFGNASIIGNNRVVFNIKRNACRLIVTINYPYSVVYIRCIGTHKQYDEIDLKEI